MIDPLVPVRDPSSTGDCHSLPADYGWPRLGREDTDPLVLFDLDGTARGEVLPMIKLARPLIGIHKLEAARGLRSTDSVFRRFIKNLGHLWKARSSDEEQRRRYKKLFSELHHAAAALLEGVSIDETEEIYRAELPDMADLWHDSAVHLLDRITRNARVAMVTGSEQVQTRVCVELLRDRVQNLERISVYGSMYGVERESRRHDGSVHTLNVSLDGKRDAVRSILSQGPRRILAAFGNSRPDRALFEVVEPRGLRVLVCPERVLRAKSSMAFASRKFERSGLRLVWQPKEYFDALDRSGALPVLATDPQLSSLLEDRLLAEAYAELMAPAEPLTLSVS